MTDVTFAGKWLKNFLSFMKVTEHFDIVLLTFNEGESSSGENKVYTAISGKEVTVRATSGNHEQTED